MLSYINIQNIVNIHVHFNNREKETITRTTKPSMYPSKVLYPTLYNYSEFGVYRSFFLYTFNTYVYIYVH